MNPTLVGLLAAFPSTTLGTFNNGSGPFCELRCYLPKWTPVLDLYGYLRKAEKMKIQLPASTHWQLEYNRAGACIACRLPFEAVSLLESVNAGRALQGLKPIKL